MNKIKSSNHINFLSDGALNFFGKMTASSTHEIKNSLAIINENAGLLGDLVSLTENGHTLSLEKIRKISDKIQNQVKRTDTSLKKLNRFSHTVDVFDVCKHNMDEPEELVNLQEAVDFIIDFASRLIQRSECTIEVKTGVSPAIVTSRLFYVQYLLWRVIEGLCYYKDNKDQISIKFDSSAESSTIWFSSSLLDDAALEKILGTPQDLALTDHLGVLVKINNNGTLGLIWSKST